MDSQRLAIIETVRKCAAFIQKNQIDVDNNSNSGSKFSITQHIMYVYLEYMFMF